LEFGDVGFCGGTKTGVPGENPRSKARTNNQLNSHRAPGQNRTQATLVGALLPLRHHLRHFKRNSMNESKANLMETQATLFEIYLSIINILTNASLILYFL